MAGPGPLSAADVEGDAAFAAAWARVEPYTMTGKERGWALWNAVLHVVDRDIPGALVECGVWKGGSAMLMILALQHRQAVRDLVLFDTFEGMTAPGPQDVDCHGDPAGALMQGLRGPRVAELVKAAAPLDAVREAIAATGVDMRLVRFVQGDVARTAPVTQTLHIALLRLDTDFYDSTLAEMRHLYPRLSSGGVLIVDDWGHWQGARQAVEDHFARNDGGDTRPMFWPIDYTARGAVKTDPPRDVEIARYDYLPPGMEMPDLLAFFPHAVPGNGWALNWPWLRPAVPHVWRVDTRHTGYTTGYASVEEAACLLAVARQMSGRRGIEVGTHYGWTAAHLLLAGLRLDCVDPAFAIGDRQAEVAQALDGVMAAHPGSGCYRLFAAPSPEGVAQAFAANGREPWSFAFIDGNHDGDAPETDARAVLPCLAPDAVVMFHDMTSPFVARGLAVFAEAGFQTCIYNTAQIMGLAWRGDVAIPAHVPDPNTLPVYAPHLSRYVAAGQGWGHGARRADGG